MRKLLTNKIFIIISLAMFIFASFSVVLINFLNNKMLGENVRNFTAMYLEEVSGVAHDPLIKEKDRQVVLQGHLDDVDVKALRIIVCDREGNILVDNAETGLENIREDKYEVGFDSALEGNDSTYIAESSVYNSPVMLHYALVPDSDWVIRVEMQIGYTSSYFIMMVPIVLAIMIVVLIIAYFSINGLVENAITPLTNIHNNLVDISRGEYHKYEIQTKYPEVQRMVEELDTASLKISNSLNYLNYEKEKSKFILDNMSQGILAVAPNGVLILMNRSAQRILDCSSTLLGESLDCTISDKKLLDRISKIIDTGVDTVFEYETEDKTTFSVEIKNINESWYDGKEGIIRLLIFTDITSESQSANIRSEFFANASHELKTPLTAIKGFSELLTISHDSKMVEKCSGEIMKNTDKMLSLINDMLELSRMDAKVQDADFKILELRSIAEEVKSKIEPIAKSKNISVNISGEGKILGVEKQIEEVLTNLMDNAIKYNNQDGFVNVNIQEGERKVIVTVEDNGIGIESKHHSRLFERFYVVDKSRDKKVSSTGLGLSIVKHIVNIHKGKLALASKLGVGTKFTIEFPDVDSFDSVLN